MDRWDMVIFACAAYLAVVTLVRLMAGRRNMLIEHVKQQIEKARAAKLKKKNQAAADSERGAA